MNAEDMRSILIMLTYGLSKQLELALVHAQGAYRRVDQV